VAGASVGNLTGDAEGLFVIVRKGDDDGLVVVGRTDGWSEEVDGWDVINGDGVGIVGETAGPLEGCKVVDGLDVETIALGVVGE